MNLLFILILLSSFTLCFGQKKSSKLPYDKGISKINREDYAGAIKEFSAAITLDSTNARAYHKRGYAKALTQNHAGALVDLNQAIELSPGNAQSYSDRGTARYNLKDKEGACMDWEQAIKLGFSEAKEMLHEYCK